MEQRINLYKQLRAFYRFVFNSEKNITPLHSSLYVFLLNQNNRADWVTWFKCPADTAMHGALINSNKTYYKTLNELVEYGLIEVQKGINNYKAPKIKIIKLKYDTEDNISEISKPAYDTSVFNTPLYTLLSTQVPTQVHTQLHTLLSTLLPTLKDKPNTIIQLTIKQKEDYKYFSFDCLIGYDELLQAWFEYKKERKESYKSEKSKEQFYKSLLALSSNNPETAKKIIEKSMANNWAGIFEYKEDLKKPIEKPKYKSICDQFPEFKNY